VPTHLRFAPADEEEYFPEWEGFSSSSLEEEVAVRAGGPGLHWGLPIPALHLPVGAAPGSSMRVADGAQEVSPLVLYTRPQYLLFHSIHEDSKVRIEINS
jgi:hypothetical protein